MIYYAITRFIMHFNDLLCNYQIYYVFKRFIMQLSDLLCIEIIYYAIIRYIRHLNDLLCNYPIYNAIKMIYYAIKWFTIQLFDFEPVPSEKNGRAGVEPGPRRLE